MSESDYFDQAWIATHRAEGGYVDNPADPGGKTNHGITERVARAQGYTGDMRELPAELARLIAKREYWDALRLDEIAAISPAIAYELFDTNLNMWWGAAIKFLQIALNACNMQGAQYPDVVTDGRIGVDTLTALRRFLERRGKGGENVMLACLNAQQCVDYLRQVRENPAKEEFFFGWIANRVIMSPNPLR